MKSWRMHFLCFLFQCDVSDEDVDFGKKSLWLFVFIFYSMVNT
jgi:hypothetical protein